jgi:biotin synthase-like enzyme
MTRKLSAVSLCVFRAASMPETQVRLSAGRMNMSREGQAMCFFAGANSILQEINY